MILVLVNRTMKSDDFWSKYIATTPEQDADRRRMGKVLALTVLIASVIAAIVGLIALFRN